MEKRIQDSLKDPEVALRFIGLGEDDLRWFILYKGRHAGGITVYAGKGGSFSYGIAISPPLRGKGIAGAALRLLFADMAGRGYSRVWVIVLKTNEASLRLHRSLGFTVTGHVEDAVNMERKLNEYEK